MHLKRSAVLAALAAAALMFPGAAHAQALPECSLRSIDIDGLPSNIVEGERYYFTVYDEASEDVSVAMAVQGQAPFWTGTIPGDDSGLHPNVWIEADPGNPPLVITATATVLDWDPVGDCQDTVVRVVNHHAGSVRLFCNDSGDTYRVRKPRKCVFGEAWMRSHSDGTLYMHNIHRWRGWGKSVAYARSVWEEGMGFRAHARLKFYRLRVSQGYKVYTRLRVYHIRWNHKGIGYNKPVILKLPTS